jgi:hypothetical protein
MLTLTIHRTIDIWTYPETVVFTGLGSTKQHSSSDDEIFADSSKARSTNVHCFNCRFSGRGIEDYCLFGSHLVSETYIFKVLVGRSKGNSRKAG